LLYLRLEFKRKVKQKSKLDFHVIWTYIAYCTDDCAAPLTMNYKIINKRRKMYANNIYYNDIYLISHPCMNVNVGNIYYIQTYFFSKKFLVITTERKRLKH